MRVLRLESYKLFPDNNIVLPIFGVLFSIPCFRYIVGKPQLASSGRFVLLTYNLTALYSYNLRKTEVEVEQIAYQRTVVVIVGVLWATVLKPAHWPFEARRQLALGVSDVLFKLAWLYQRLVLSYSRDPSQERSSHHVQANTMMGTTALTDTPMTGKTTKRRLCSAPSHHDTATSFKRSSCICRSR